METNVDSVVDRRFRRGIIFAWVPLAFFTLSAAIELAVALQSSKATGLGAVAGGISEVVVAFGILTIVASEIAGIVMLLRSFSRKHPMRGIIAAVTVCLSAILLLILAFFVRIALTHNWL